jgi:hypothetical protein
MCGLRHNRQTEDEDRGHGQHRPELSQAQGGSQLKGEALRGGKTEAAIHGDSFLIAPGAGAQCRLPAALNTPPQSAKAESGGKSVQESKEKVRIF